MRDNAHLTIPELIEQHYLRLAHRKNVKQSAFVAAIRDHYESEYHKAGRTIEFSQHDDPAERMRIDADTFFNKWLDPHVKARFPAEIIESVVAAFPAEERYELQADLAARQGLLAVPIPAAGMSADNDNLGRLGKEVAEGMMEVSKMLDDGKIDRKDASTALAAIKELRDVQAVSEELIQRIIEQTGVRPTADVVSIKDKRAG